jgi:hypothetical protein
MDILNHHLIYDKKILLRIDSYETFLPSLIKLYMGNLLFMISYVILHLIYMLYQLSHTHFLIANIELRNDLLMCYHAFDFGGLCPYFLSN